MTQRVPASASVQDALAMARSAMSFVYAADAAAMAVDSQAGALRDLEVLDAIQTVARASYLNVFMSAQGHVGDADYGPRAWLMHKTGITRGAAAGHVGWARRVAVHPELGKALAAGEVSESYGRMIATWTDRLPEDCRPAADAILLGAARSGMDLTDLTGLAAGIHHRSMPGDQDPDHFGDRSVRVGATLDGAGVIRGDLTPQCAAVVTTVLDAVSAPADPGDTRSRAQRYHDGLQDAMERLVAAGLLPERAGVPVKVWAHICLADLMELAGASAVARQWVAGARAAWAAHRAAGPAGGGDGGVWLTGGPAAGAACDGSVAPVVPGAVNPGAFYHLVTLAAELADLGYLPHRAAPGQPLTGSQPSGDGQPTSWGQPSGSGPDAGSRPAGAPAAPAGPAVPGPEVLRRWEALEQAIVAQAVQLLSGPGGLVSHVRRGMAGGRLGGPASRWTSGTARRSRPGSGTRSGSATSTAPGPADTSSKHTSRVDRCRLARPGLAARCHLSHLAAAELLLTMGHLNLLLSCIAVISNGVFDVHQT
jgi:Domain of unknown function (DUF222)